MEIEADALVAVAIENHFTGAVRVETGDECLFEAAFGMADRAHGVPNTPQTQFAMASGSKEMPGSFFSGAASLGGSGGGPGGSGGVFCVTT